MKLKAKTSQQTRATEVMAPDWMVKAVMIEEFPEFFKMIKKQRVAVNEAGGLEIDDAFRRMVPDADAICRKIYEKAWQFEFESWAHLKNLK